MHTSKNVELVLQVLCDEIHGRVQEAAEKITDDYSMTWMYEKKDGSLFPTTGKDPIVELEEVYTTKGRKYEIRHIAEGDNVVILELTESYPDPETGKVYRTPEVIVLEFEDGKIRTGRHYCDPRLSYRHLSSEEIEKAFKNSAGDLLVLDEKSP
jgi:ketosteroid isomerase-like protein